MNFLLGSPLLARAASGEEAVYEFARLESLRDSGGWMLALVAGVVVLLVYIWLFYRREARTVSLTKAMSLASLRTVAVAGLVAFFLGLEKRSSNEVVEPSRVAILVDTSLSMNLPDGPSKESTNDSTDESVTRTSRVLGLLADTPLVEELAAVHDVDLVAFDETARPVAYLPMHQADSEELAEVEPARRRLASERLAESFLPEGHETRLGDAIATTLERYRGLPLAGIVLLTDGGQNGGLELASAGDAASAVGAPIHSIGFGPLVAPMNMAARELIAPEQAYPGDNLTLQAVIQTQGKAARQLELQLFRRPVSEGPDAGPDGDQPNGAEKDIQDWELVASEQATTEPGDDLQTIRFETTPAEAGEFVYEVRIAPGRGESATDDNRAQAEVAIVARKTCVLLYAGGPARDYRFLRNQLRRDKTFTVDVLLESGVEGISQDADQILHEFPTSAEQLSAYDAIVAFDPDWSLLGADQVGWLEQWIARQAGGLIVVPGKVNMPRWGVNASMRSIRGLYPVRLPQQMLDLRNDSRPRDTPEPFVFTREGRDAEFLWLADSRQENEAAWRQFDGVFGALPHLGPKPGAMIYATLQGVADEPGPAYLASHYYGAGQVFYIGSSELWRLRAVDTHFVDRLWTGLLRHVSQGRLLQGSPRGKLLVSQDRYEVGDTVPLRAVVSDLQLEPLVAESLPLTVELPGGGHEPLAMLPEPNKVGNFAAEFRVVVPGAYRFVLPIPDSESQLTRSVRVAIPQREIRQTTRNVSALRRLAEQTGGQYYASAAIALAGSNSLPSLVAATPSKARTKRLLGTIDEPFARRLSFTWLAIVAGALCLEWILRRWSYLA